MKKMVLSPQSLEFPRNASYKSAHATANNLVFSRVFSWTIEEISIVYDLADEIFTSTSHKNWQEILTP